MQNNVVLQFASGSEYSDLEVHLPFECRYCSGVQAQDMSSSDYNEEDCDDEEEDTDLDSFDHQDDGDEMYEMNVSLVIDPIQDINNPSNTRLLLAERYSPAHEIKIVVIDSILMVNDLSVNEFLRILRRKLGSFKLATPEILSL